MTASLTRENLTSRYYPGWCSHVQVRHSHTVAIDTRRPPMSLTASGAA
jgi:hypothetical protein